MVDPFRSPSLLQAVHPQHSKAVLFIFLPMTILTIISLVAICLSVSAIKQGQIHPHCACKTMINQQHGSLPRVRLA